MLQQYCLQRLARIQFDDHRLVDVASDIGTVGGLLEDAGQLAGVNVNPLRQALASGQIERLTDTQLRLCLFADRNDVACLDQHGSDVGGVAVQFDGAVIHQLARSEEHTSELQSLMRISYAVFCLNKKTKINMISTEDS